MHTRTHARNRATTALIRTSDACNNGVPTAETTAGSQREIGSRILTGSSAWTTFMTRWSRDYLDDRVPHSPSPKLLIRGSQPQHHTAPEVDVPHLVQVHLTRTKLDHHTPALRRPPAEARPVDHPRRRAGKRQRPPTAPGHQETLLTISGEPHLARALRHHPGSKHKAGRVRRRLRWRRKTERSAPRS
jgi:hypothetical protein